jgi:hypothetical protein
MAVETDKQMGISKIVVKMGKREIDLSVEDAKNLFRLLEEMFGEKIKEVHHDHYYPRWLWNYPTYYCGSSGTLTYDSNTIDTIANSGGVVYCNLSQ